jgi:hypothetical protein
MLLVYVGCVVNLYVGDGCCILEPKVEVEEGGVGIVIRVCEGVMRGVGMEVECEMQGGMHLTSSSYTRGR